MVPAVPVKPATSTSSVGGKCPCAASRVLMTGSRGGNREAPSGSGNTKPPELSKGSPDTEKKRWFHISAGKKAVFAAIGVRRWLRGPKRFCPTRLLFWIPIAIDCVSPNPFVGE